MVSTTLKLDTTGHTTAALLDWLVLPTTVLLANTCGETVLCVWICTPPTGLLVPPFLKMKLLVSV